MDLSYVVYNYGDFCAVILRATTCKSYQKISLQIHQTYKNCKIDCKLHTCSDYYVHVYYTVYTIYSVNKSCALYECSDEAYIPT